MIKAEINGLNDVKNFLVALADNLAQAVKEEIAANGFGSPGKTAHRRPHRHGAAHVTHKSKRGQRNFHVPGLDSKKRGGA
jgi:hypothetical protein